MLGYYIRRGEYIIKSLLHKPLADGNSTLAMEIAKVLGVPCIQAGKIETSRRDYEYHGEEQFLNFSNL